MGSLDSVRLKLEWAAKHHDALSASITSYVQTNPCKFRVERYSASYQHAWGRFVTDVPVPLEMTLIFGDILQSLHSSLDYLVRELVLSVDKEPTSSHSFPIADSRAAFEEEIGRKRLRDVPFQAVAVIEALQPYNAGNDLHKSPLWALKTFTNIHKHRRILLTSLSASPAPFDFEVIEIDGVPFGKFTPGPADLDTVFGPFTLSNGKVDMEINFAVCVVLDETPYRGHELTAFARWIGMALKDTLLPQFETFF